MKGTLWEFKDPEVSMVLEQEGLKDSTNLDRGCRRRRRTGYKSQFG